MSENNAPLDDDFDLATAGVDTSMPILEAGNIPCVIHDITVEENSKKTGKNAVVVLETLEPCRTKQGDVMNAGYKGLKMYLPLQAWEKDETGKAFLKNIAAAQDAALGTDINTRPPFNRACIQEMKGKSVIAVVTVDKRKDANGNDFEGNGIKRIEAVK